MFVCGAPPRLRRGLVLLRRAAAAALPAGVAVLIAGSAAAAPRDNRGRDVSGLVGVGFNSGEAPLGVRYLWTPRAGIDVAMGFRVEGGGLPDRAEIVLEGAYLHAMAPGRNVNFYVTPGVRFTNISVSSRSTTTIRFFAALDLEYFLTDRLSLGARTGFYVESASPPEGARDRVNLGTLSGMLGQAGVRAYFGRPPRRFRP